MAEKSFDVLVLGGGPGGYTAAIRASQLGLHTAIVEKDRLGGICLNWGCVPTKALIRNAEVYQTFKKAEEWGISVEHLKFDFSKIIRRSRGIAERISKGVEFLMKKNHIEYIAGSGKLRDAHTLEVTIAGRNSVLLEARHIILATGARPRSIPGVNLDSKRVISSTEAMSLTTQPKSMVIVGAGAIGVEFAYFYNALGTKVTLLEMMPGILPIEDRELTRLLETSLKKQGIEVLTQTKVESIKPGAHEVAVSIRTSDSVKELTGEFALMAVGVQGNVENIGLEQLGVAIERSQIEVNQDFRTNVEGLYAIGDVIGPPWLAHVASAEGIHCAESIAGKKPAPLDYTLVPSCTYAQPQLASVGLTEEKALAEGHELRIGRCQFRPLGKSMAISEPEGMVKLIFDARYGELLGAHILGTDATEMIAELVVAKKLETTGQQLLETIHAHPTLSEAVMEAAAAAYGQAINL